MLQWNRGDATCREPLGSLVRGPWMAVGSFFQNAPASLGLFARSRRKHTFRVRFFSPNTTGWVRFFKTPQPASVRSSRFSLVDSFCSNPKKQSDCFSFPAAGSKSTDSKAASNPLGSFIRPGVRVSDVRYAMTRRSLTSAYSPHDTRGEPDFQGRRPARLPSGALHTLPVYYPVERMFRLVAFLALPAVLAAQLGDKDTLIIPGQPWHVHDPDRPHPRMVAPDAQPGEWNIYDIVFEAPKFEGDRLRQHRPASPRPVRSARKVI